MVSAAGTTLDTDATFTGLALFVDATDSGITDATSQPRLITWDSDVVVLGGPSPELVVDSNGVIEKAVNIGVNGGQTAGNMDPEGDGGKAADLLQWLSQPRNLRHRAFREAPDKCPRV